ncbi:MAG: NAD(P)H-hydrate epimerase, partial [Candidatus Methylomirabilia bacterium]
MSELGIPGPRLMERAGEGAARAIRASFGTLRGKRVVICCGKGNNGGDGFVVARQLRAAGASVRVFLLAQAREVKGDAARMLGAYRSGGGKIVEVTQEHRVPDLEKA